MRRITSFADGVDALAAGLNAAFYTSLIAKTFARKANQTSWATWPGDGAIHRFAFIPNLTRPGAGFLSKVIDNQVDWRDRIIRIQMMYSDPVVAGPGAWQGPIVPGVDSDKFLTQLTPAQGGGLLYTRQGVTQDSTPGGNHLITDFPAISIYARSTDGALMIQRASTDSTGDPRSWALFIIASEPTGRQSLPAASPTLAPVDSNAILASELNGFQDRALLGQVREKTGSLTDAYPIGPKGTGDRVGAVVGKAYVPDLWTIRGSRRRQPVVGGAFRYFVVTATTGTTKVLDSSIDWRDRIVWGLGRHSSTQAIEPGGTNETAHNAATTWNVSRYTGSGESAGAAVHGGYHLLLLGASFPTVSVFADSTTGELKIANGTGTTRKVTGMIWSTPQLGIRS